VVVAQVVGERHHLAPGTLAGNPIEAARDLVGLHGTDPSSAYLACWARVRGFTTDALANALYEERSLLKILGMRRTMFLVPPELAAVIQSACTDSIARGERARLHRMIREAGISEDPERWLGPVEEQTLEALDRLGEATAAEMTREVEGLRAQIPVGSGKRWEGTVGVSTRLLLLLSAEGRIIRGRPRGTIVSSLYRWSLMDHWIPGGLPTIPKDEAQAELVRRYLETFGPATLRDVQWWTGWTMTETRRALAGANAHEVKLGDGKPGWVGGDWQPSERAAQAHWIALLPPLDSTIMGWQDRDWFLGAHKLRVFDRIGNAGPSIWLDGRVVGGWAQRKSGEIPWQLLEDVGVEVTREIEAKIEDLREWLGALRFIPRFRTPIEQELTA
jgi:hypothetical protein